MPTWFAAFMVASVVLFVIGNSVWLVLLRGWVAPGAGDSDRIAPDGQAKATLAATRPNPISPTYGRSGVGSGIEMYEDRLIASPKFRAGARWTFDREAIRESKVRWVPDGSVVVLFDEAGDRVAIIFSAHPVAATRRALADGGWLGRWSPT